MALKGAQLYGKHVVAPVAKFAVKQAMKQPGIANAPEVQAAQAMFRDAKAAYQSPQGQAMLNQMVQAARSPQAQAMVSQAGQIAKSPQAQAAATGLLAAAAPQLARYATPVPVAAPAAPAAPAVPSGPLTVNDMSIVRTVLWHYANGNPPTPEDLPAGPIAQTAKAINNKDRNNAVLTAMGDLAKEVKTLHDAGTPQTLSFESAKEMGRGRNEMSNTFLLYETLTDPAVRSRIARTLVSVQDPPGQPNARRFLAGTINQIAAATRNAMQKRLLLGGRKTRRGRKAVRKTRRSP